MSGGLLDGHVIDAAQLVSTGAGELSGNVLTKLGIATGRDKELGVLKRDRNALFEAQVPELVFVIADGQRRLSLSGFRQTFDIDIRVLDPSRGIQVVLKIGRLVQEERLGRCATCSHQDGQSKLEVSSKFYQRALHALGLPRSCRRETHRSTVPHNAT